MGLPVPMPGGARRGAAARRDRREAVAAAARQKCVTVVNNRAGMFFGQVFATRTVPKVCNSRQKSSGLVFRAGFCNSKSAKSV